MRRLALVAAWLVPALAAAAPLPDGRYDAELCVASGAAAASCGSAELDARSGGRIEVRVADIVYRLRLRSLQLDVATRQGTTEIDAFSAPYDWDGKVLRFRDAGKDVVYEVRPATRRKSTH